MNPQLLSVDAQDPSKDRRFRTREFSRMLGMVWPYRGLLSIGLLSTVVFAGLHTVSIGGAFPVFKILLEEEGLSGWMDRTVAGDRLGVEFAQPTDRLTVGVINAGVRSDGRATLRKGDVISDARDRPVAELLHQLAHAAPGESVTVKVKRSDKRLSVNLQPATAGTTSRLLLRAGSLIPPDAQGGQGKLRTLVYILCAVVALVVVANVFRYLGEILIAKAILRSMMDLRARLYERTLHLPMSFFANQPTSDLVTCFVQDVQEIQRGLMTFFGKFIREPLRAVLILCWALVLDWRITLTMVVVAPITVAIFWAIGRSVKKANRRLLQAYGHMIGALTASLQNLGVVKAYTAEAHERERLQRVDRRMFKQQLKLAKLQAFVSPTIETLAIASGSVMTIWLASRVLNHDLSMSEFVTLGITLSVLFDPLRKLTDVYVRVQRSTAGAERILRVIDQPLETGVTDARIELKPLEHAIEFDNVSFTYPGANSPAVKEVSLEIRQGEAVAIVGPNGSGKTTLVSLLPRFYVPDTGKIHYDGVDISEVSLASLRRQIGFVTQDAVVFAGTPVENIAYGISSPDDERVQASSRRAHADEFIRDIPGGYQAVLGERGTTLSGGQRQRIAIARAIFRDAPVLIFDEATSQIDTESELKIQNAVKDFAKGRTTLIIAHRLSTIQFADRIAVMDAGRLIDTGTHKELFERCPLYRTLCETQFLNGPDAD